MKHLIVAIAALASLTASAQIGVDAIAKQRARDVANQNNNRVMQQGGGAAPSQAVAAPTVSATPPTAGQQAYAAFQSKLLAMTTNSPATAKDDLAKSMANVAQGANKPSEATVTKLTEHLTTALNEATKLTSTKKVYVARNVAVLLNSVNTPPDQRVTMIKGVQSNLEAGGAASDSAAAVAVDLQSVVEEVRAK